MGGSGEALTGGGVASDFAVVSAAESSEVLPTLARALATPAVGARGGARAGGVGGSEVDGECTSFWAATADAGELFASASGCGDSAGTPEKHDNPVRSDRRAHGM